MAQVVHEWRFLVLLDNFEHVLEAAAFLSQLLDECPHLHLLVTCRVRLALAEEYAFRLEGLETESASRATPEAVQLFRDRAVRAGTELDLELYDDDVRSICREIEGYPLGIELAASLTRLLTPAEILRELHDALNQLGGADRDAPARHRTVRAAFIPSWMRLTKQQARVLGCLSVFRGGVHRDAAQEVAGANLTVLSWLIDQALLRTDTAHWGRFVFHPLVHKFVREHTTGDVLDNARADHQAFFGALLDRSASAVIHDPRDTLDRLEIELPNILGAINNAFHSEQGDQAIQMLSRLIIDCGYFEARPINLQLLQLVRRGAELAEKRDELRAAHLLLTQLGHAYRDFENDMEASRLVYQQALGISERLGDYGRRAILHGLLGAVLADDTDASDTHLHRAKQLAEENGETLARCYVLQKWSYVACQRKQWRFAQKLCHDAVRIGAPLLHAADADRVRVEQALYFTYHNLGVAEDGLGQIDASLVARRHVLDLAEKRDNQLWQAKSLEGITWAYHVLGNRDLASESFQKAKRLYHQHGAVPYERRVERELTELGYQQPNA